MSKRILFWVIVLLLIAAAGFWYWYSRKASGAAGQQAQAAMAAGQAMPIQTAAVKRQDVTEYQYFTGTTQAVNAIDVVARVEGYLEAVHFEDGSIVEKDQLLFTIERSSYVARRNEAAARLKAAEAELESARLDFERMQQAIQTNAVSQQDLSRSEAAFRTAEASVAQSKAALESAELDLGYTEVRSPIRGRVGRHLVDVGNLVGSGQRTLLTTVVQIEPIHVFFYAGEDILRGDVLSRVYADDQSRRPTMLVGLPNENDYPYAGVIDFVDNTVDPGTGTIYVRGQLPNAEGDLLGGMFVRVRVPVTVRQNAILVPEKAVSSDLGGKFLLVVGDGNILRRQNVTLGSSVDDMRVVLDGLKGDETFIISSFHLARPGMPITPIPAGGPGPAGMTAPQ